MEPWFLINYYHTHMSMDEFKKLKIIEIRWLINRIEKELEKASQNNQPSKSPHHNDSQTRALQGLPNRPPGSKMFGR